MIIRILKIARKNIIFLYPENPVDPVKKYDFAVVPAAWLFSLRK